MGNTLKTPKTGANRQSYEDCNPRHSLRMLMEKNPEATVDDIISMIWDEVREDEKIIFSIVAYWATNNYRYLQKEISSSDAALMNRISSSQALNNAVSAGESQFKNIVNATAFTILSDMLPNGKKLGDTTFGECAEIGGFLAKVAKLGPPEKMVKEVLTNKELKMLQI